MNSKWFFPRLYRHSKLLFALVVLAFALHINANFFFGGQQTPFFHWNLYAEPVPHQDSFNIWEVEYNGGKILKTPYTWQQPGTLLMMLPLRNYMYLLEHGRGPMDQYILNWNKNHPSLTKIFPQLKFYPGTTEMNAFPNWFTLKLEQYLGHPVSEINILKTTLKYKDNGRVQVLSRIPVCKLK